ncbi:MAG: Ig domain-containing protein, partial [Planctomycetes bacterium]|nr:Ig domain-containing protein [Planctomycetota bacterium]
FDPVQAGDNFDGSFDEVIDVGTLTGGSVQLWPGASFYISVRAYNSAGLSGPSNVEYLYIPSTADNSCNLTYRVHAADIGWMDWVENGEIAGTTGESRQIEAVEIRLDSNTIYSPISYRAHTADIGWMGWVENGEIAGTTGESRRLEALEIDVDFSGYEIRYRAHVADTGWMDWVGNGETAGTTGESRQAEALQIILRPE